jgi:CubicO group peptidase (beta-lactamase class C family)
MRTPYPAPLAGLALLFLAAAPALAQSPVPPAKYVEQAKAIVDGYVKKNQFTGTVLIARDGKPILSQGFGLANRELNVAAKPETVFRLGSITKQFTAASIMQLAEAGKLSVDDPISKYYAAAPAAWSKITLKHLLSHRSGIPSYTGLPGFFEKQATADRTPEQIIELTRDMPLEFEPGAKFNYDNTGYIILGYVIEKVSGEKYADYVRKRIFEPLGMKHSGYDDTRSILPNRAAGYEFEKGVWTNAPYLAMSLPYAAGSLYSTTGDLLIWEEAFFADKVVSKASRAAMTSDYGNGYGFGLGSGKLGSHAFVSHNGGINGFATDLSRFPADGLTIIVLSNATPGQSSRIANELARLYLGVSAPPPPPLTAVAVKPEVLDRYVGEYELMKGFNIVVKHEGDRLTAQATGQNAFTLTPTSDTVFHFQPAGITMTFPAGDDPAPTFELLQGPTPRTATRVTPAARPN